MIQRLATHWRIRRARSDGQAAIARLQSAGALTATFDNETMSLDVDGRTLCVRYADCEDAEDVGGLIYVWLREGGPIVVPTRALSDAGEAARLVSRLSSHTGVGAWVSQLSPTAIARTLAPFSTNRALPPDYRRGSGASAASASHAARPDAHRRGAAAAARWESLDRHRTPRRRQLAGAPAARRQNGAISRRSWRHRSTRRTFRRIGLQAPRRWLRSSELAQPPQPRRTRCDVAAVAVRFLSA